MAAVASPRPGLVRVWALVASALLSTAPATSRVAAFTPPALGITGSLQYYYGVRCLSSELHSFRADLEALRVPELKELLRTRGLMVSGRKAELVGRLLEGGDNAEGFSSASAEQLEFESCIPATQHSVHSNSIPLDGIVIEAGKSWGLFQRTAFALENKIREVEPNVLIFGHPRGKGAKAWTPIDLKDIEGESKTAPTGTFRVRLGPAEVERVVLQVGPEERPFPILREFDVDRAAEDIVKALRGVR